MTPSFANLTLRLLHRVREQHFDQRAGVAAGLDLESGPVGLDQRPGQRQADAGIVGGLTRRRRRTERIHRGGDFIVVETLAGIAHPQHHVAEIG